MGTVIATKGKLIRKFTKFAWDKLGKDKSGWVEVSDQKVSNDLRPGTKNIPVANSANELELILETANNATTENAIEILTDGLKKFPDSKMLSKSLEEQKQRLAELKAKYAEPATSEALKYTAEQFVETFLSEFDKDAIKNYFDSVGVKYSKKDSVDTLQIKLAEHFEMNEEKFKAALS